jgi:hypothetical protein
MPRPHVLSLFMHTALQQVCNWPRVWTKNNQTSYMPQLGTSLSNGLLKVAFKQYGNQPPRLFFTPVSEFLEVGADVSACINSRRNPATTRRLLAGAKVGPCCLDPNRGCQKPGTCLHPSNRTQQASTLTFLH